MSDMSGQTTQQLFSQWRGGDAGAGQAMAQRFSDWYYAIAASRLGDSNCRMALERACQRFAQGVASVSSPDALAPWAHEIIAEEIQVAGGRVAGGDHPNALTDNRSPIELLRNNRMGISQDQVALLGMAYDANVSAEAVRSKAEELGGYPLAVLEARYALKRHLRDADGVGFTEIPDRPNLDWGPLPLYEGGRMGEGKEETAFEIWMLSDITLCRDIAEFAAFALALRGGVLSAEELASAPMPVQSSSASSNGDAKVGRQFSGFQVVLIVCVVVLLLAICTGLMILPGATFLFLTPAAGG